MMHYIKRRWLEKAKSKKQISNIKIATRVLNYAAMACIIIFAIFSYAGSWSGLGLTVGLLSAALGWALQKPITGIAAWFMVVIKRPFEIGDRIVIGSIKGDVTDITLSHIYLKEIGGLIASEENSGRIILVPNSILFEQNIINYTAHDEYVLDQVVAGVTYESNLDRAIEICLQAAKKHTHAFSSHVKVQPYVRTYFLPSSIGVHVRYFAPATQLQEVSSDITKEIYEQIRKRKDVEIAYPHTEVVFKKGTRF